MSDLLPFLVYKNPVLRVANSFQANVNLDRTTPEDRDSPLEYGSADVFLRAQL